MKIVPERLKNKRCEHRYSQRALAKAAGVPYHAVLNIESGKVKQPKYIVIVAIARVLRTNPEEFFLDCAAVDYEQVNSL